MAERSRQPPEFGMPDQDRFVRVYEEVAKLSSYRSREAMLRHVVCAARSLVGAERAEFTVLEPVVSEAGLALWSGEVTSTLCSTLEREVVAGGRRCGTLRLTTSRPGFLAEDEVVLDCFVFHVGAALEHVWAGDEGSSFGAVPSERGADAAPPAPSIRECGDMRIDLGRFQLFVAGEPVHATISEFRLLELLTERPGHAYTRGEIAMRLWGQAGEFSPRAADSHVARLRRKIERDPREPERLVSVRGVGYRLESVSTSDRLLVV